MQLSTVINGMVNKVLKNIENILDVLEPSYNYLSKVSTKWFKRKLLQLEWGKMVSVIQKSYVKREN